MKTLDEELVQHILTVIDDHLERGILPVHNDHLRGLSQNGEVLDYLLVMKKDGLISGDVITKGEKSTPYRMTNIRLTYLGIKQLRSYV
jgi:hypothetical protein